jgi:hypothetical protein
MVAPLPPSRDNQSDTGPVTTPSSLDGVVTPTSEVYFFHLAVSIIKMSKAGQPVDPEEIKVKGRLAVKFPGLVCGKNIFVPREALIKSGEQTPSSRKVPTQELVPISGEIERMFHFTTEEHPSTGRRQHVAVWTRSGSLYLVTLLRI